MVVNLFYGRQPDCRMRAKWKSVTLPGNQSYLSALRPTFGICQTIKPPSKPKNRRSLCAIGLPRRCHRRVWTSSDSPVFWCFFLLSIQAICQSLKIVTIIVVIMASLLMRAGLWCSLAAAVVAVYFRLQQPLQEILASGAAGQIYCYSGGVTPQFSANSSATCFTVKDGVFVDVFTPTSDLPAEARQGHAIPGLWDGVSKVRGLARAWMDIKMKTSFISLP